MNKKITKYVYTNNWAKLNKLIRTKEHIDTYDDLIINGNSLFHIACIRKQETFMKSYLDLAAKYPNQLNPNHVNKDGLPGLHLYFKYGGNNSWFLNEPYICIQDATQISLLRYVYGNIDNLEQLVANAKKYNCIENLVLSKQLQTEIIPLLINEINNKDVEKSVEKSVDKRYSKIFDDLLPFLDIEILLAHITISHRTDILQKMIDAKINLHFQTKNKETPLIVAVSHNNTDFVKIILSNFASIYSSKKLYNIIAYGGSKNNQRPIHVAIANNNLVMLVLIITFIKSQIKDTFVFTETDQFHNTYLHALLHQKKWIRHVKKNKTEYKILVDILKLFVQHTDINYSNYWGITCMHMLLKSGLWLLVVDQLKNQKFTNVDTSFLSTEDKKYFVDLFGNAHNKSTTKLAKVQNLFPTSNHMFGTFNSNLVHNMLYMVYLLKKYPILYIPYVTFNKREKDDKIFWHKMKSYNISPTHLTMNFLILRMLNMFYTYSPHYLVWANNKHFYIDDSLVKLLKTHNKTHPVTKTKQKGRYVLLKLTLVISNDVLHSNIILYDRLNKIGRRFEPTGVSDIIDGDLLDAKIASLLTKAYGGVEALERKSKGKITYLKPSDYLGEATFQLTSADDDDANKKWGDPPGYCLAWSIWFTEIRLSYPNLNDKELIKRYYSCQTINKLLSIPATATSCTNNYYLDFIRKYAILLDNEKNKILNAIGIHPSEYYNMYPNKQTIQTIIDYFKQAI